MNPTQVSNYPNQHSQNLTAKHQATGNKLKPMIRIFKNMRSKLIDDGLIEKGSAPSYYIEGLLYNVPNDQFVGDYQDIFLNILNLALCHAGSYAVRVRQPAIFLASR